MTDHASEQGPARAEAVAAVVDRLSDRFEAAWSSGAEPRIEDYLLEVPPSANAEYSQRLLRELVMIDIEHRWRSAVPPSGPGASEEKEPTSGYGHWSTFGGLPLLEDYVRQFPSMESPDELNEEAIAFEYRVRHLWGDRPSHDSYLRRFPSKGDELAAVLAQVDRELARSGVDERSNAHRRIDRRLGRFQLLELLGRGGMGAVYKALHTKLDCEVAVKLLRPELTDKPEAVARFEREMKAIGGLDHPNLARALDADQIEGNNVLVMEFVEGVDIRTLAKRLGRLSVTDACELARQTALGLKCVHEHGLVHRDIKPSNLMLALRDHPPAPSQGSPTTQSQAANRKSAIVKILDLGLAQLRSQTGEVDDLTKSGQLLGTLDYIAPEQTNDPHNVDARADLYALGCTLYKLLCGRAPFEDRDCDTVGKKILAHAQQRPAPIRERCPAVPPNLATVLDRLLAKVPDERYQTADDVAKELEPFAQGHDLAALWGSYRAAPKTHSENSIIDTDVHLASAFSGTKDGESSEPAIVPQTAARRWRPLVAATLILLMVGGLGAWQIVIWIKGKGYEIKVKFPDTSPVNANSNGTGKLEPSPGKERPVPAILPISRDEIERFQRDFAEHLDIPIERTNSLGMKLRLIPPGEFWMGSPMSESGREEDETKHRVRISKPLYMGTHEVTVDQFRRFVDATEFQTESQRMGIGAFGWSDRIGFCERRPEYTWLNPGFKQKGDHPVVCISWEDAKAFCKWLSETEKEVYRLPTEAEWEYACRAGTQTQYWTGEDSDALTVAANINAVWNPDDFALTSPVGSFRPNAFGLYDIHGNVWEMCSDWYDSRYYESSPLVDPQGPSSGTKLVLRGGSLKQDERHARSANRDTGWPGGWSDCCVGFRVVRTCR